MVKNNRVKIITEILEQLHAEKKRTQIGATLLLKNADDIPAGLVPKRIAAWLSGDTKSAPHDHLQYALKRWSDLPTCTDTRVKLDDGVLAQLNSYKESTGIGSIKLLDITDNVPDNLNPDTIDNWMNGLVESASAEHLEFALEAWAKYPQYEFVEVTDSIRQKLLEYQEKSGVGPRALLRDTHSELPEGLRYDKIEKWMGGTKEKIRKDYLDYVLERWGTITALEANQVRITEEIHQELKSHWRRTRVEPKELLAMSEAVPFGLKPSLISNWLYKKIDTARKDHLEFVLAKWKSLPSSKKTNGSLTIFVG